MKSCKNRGKNETYIFQPQMTRMTQISYLIDKNKIRVIRVICV